MREFLDSDCEEEENRIKYIQQMREVASKRRKEIFIYLDDIMQFFRENTFLVENIIHNTHRYQELFSDIIDQLMSQEINSVELDKEDVSDMLYLHHLNNERNRGEGNEEIQELPKEYFRLYQLHFIPLSRREMLKMREIKR